MNDEVFMSSSGTSFLAEMALANRQAKMLKHIEACTSLEEVLAFIDEVGLRPFIQLMKTLTKDQKPSSKDYYNEVWPKIKESALKLRGLS
jgi:ERCC4-related helicase